MTVETIPSVIHKGALLYSISVSQPDTASTPLVIRMNGATTSESMTISVKPGQTYFWGDLAGFSMGSTWKVTVSGDEADTIVEMVIVTPSPNDAVSTA